MALRNLTRVPKLCLVYFAVDKSTSVIETKKLRSKETGKPFTETAPNTRDIVTVATDGKQSSPFPIFFPIIANVAYECFAAFQVFVRIVVVLKHFTTIVFSQF